MHTSLEYTGANLTYINAMLLEHFDKDSFRLTKVRRDCARVEVLAGDIYFNAGDTLHVKRTSILVEKNLATA